MAFGPISQPQIDPSKFSLERQAAAQRAKDADNDHAARIKGTSNRAEIQDSFISSIKSWNPAKSLDRVTIGNDHKAPDGGMSNLARLLGRR